jgi:hypothetical protein
MSDTGTGCGATTGGDVEGVDPGGGGVEATGTEATGAETAGAGVVGAVAGGGVRGAGALRGADARGLGLVLRPVRVGVGDAPLLGAVRSTTRRRTASPVALSVGVAWILAVATTGGCAAPALLSGGVGVGVAVGAGVEGGAVATRVSGPCRRTFVMANAPPASNTTKTVAATLLA